MSRFHFSFAAIAFLLVGALFIGAAILVLLVDEDVAKGDYSAPLGMVLLGAGGLSAGFSRARASQKERS